MRGRGRFLAGVVAGTGVALLWDARRRRIALGVVVRVLDGVSRLAKAWADRTSGAIEAGRRAAEEKERELEGLIHHQQEKPRAR